MSNWVFGIRFTPDWIVDSQHVVEDTCSHHHCLHTVMHEADGKVEHYEPGDEKRTFYNKTCHELLIKIIKYRQVTSFVKSLRKLFNEQVFLRDNLVI